MPSAWPRRNLDQPCWMTTHPQRRHLTFSTFPPGPKPLITSTKRKSWIPTKHIRRAIQFGNLLGMWLTVRAFRLPGWLASEKRQGTKSRDVMLRRCCGRYFTGLFIAYVAHASRIWMELSPAAFLPPLAGDARMGGGRSFTRQASPSSRGFSLSLRPLSNPGKVLEKIFVLNQRPVGTVLKNPSNLLGQALACRGRCRTWCPRMVN